MLGGPPAVNDRWAFMRSDTIGSDVLSNGLLLFTLAGLYSIPASLSARR